MLNDVTAGHPTTRDDVMSAVNEVNYLYEAGRDDEALHLLDVLTDGVKSSLAVEPAEVERIVQALDVMYALVEIGEIDMDHLVRDLSESFKAA